MHRARSSVAALAVLATCAPFAALSAESAPEVLVVTTSRVTLDRSDFASRAAVEKLYARLATAARRVCTLSNAPLAYSSPCVARALDAAVADVGDDRLASVHRERRRG